MNSTDCPDIRNWQALLEGEWTEVEGEGLAHHLATCSDCQHTLEALAAAPAVWEDTAQALGEQRRREGQGPALRQVVERLKGEKPTAGEEDSIVPSARGGAGPPRPAGSVPGTGGDRSRRHGRRAQGLRPGTAPSRGHQGVGPGPGRQRHGSASFHSGDAGRRRRLSRSRRRRLQRQRGRRPALPGHAVRRRRIAASAPGPRRTAGGGGDRPHRHADGLGTGGGPCPGTDPSGHQAGQPAAGE